MGNENKLYAINSDGSLKWTVAVPPGTAGGTTQVSAIGADGTIYLVNGSELVAIH